MQSLASVSDSRSSAHSIGVRVMLLTREPVGRTASRLASYGSSVEAEGDFYRAMAGMIDDPLGYDLFVMECDPYGGVAAAERAISTLIAAEARMRVILISRDFDCPAYPLGCRTAVSLPDPATESSFRIGFEHVLRDRTTRHLM